jgi:feruloyl-CoA synthase
LPADAAADRLLADPRVRQQFAKLIGTLAAAHSGSSSRILRAVLLAEPPSLDIGEMTDKGSINQRAVLAHRAGLVEQLYAASPPPHGILAESGIAKAN